MRQFKDIFLMLRKETAYNQEEMGKQLGVSKSTVAMWETGQRKPSPELYEQIADYFNVDMDYLYGRTDIRKRVHYDADGVEYIPKENAEAYYFNDETREIAQAVFENPELRSLFDMSRKMSPERLRAHIEFMKSLQDSEN